MRERRSLRSSEERERLGVTLATHAPALGPGPIAAFVGIRGEPHTLPLLAALRARGVRVLLPILLDDLDLEWADYDGDPEGLVEGSRGILHPAGPSLGLHGIAVAELVLAPALAVDAEGRRLGQGGGSYDRALARTGAPVLAVVFDDEVVEAVPAEQHDRPVTGALTPTGGIRSFSG
jgi:5-formyltetrahydrofolate cyclo-ligase